jgi:zinc transport system substrate-binding protein
MQENNIQYVYYEELIAPRVAEVLAKETGATLLKLHGAHNISKEEFEKGVSFLSLMEGNLKNLKAGLECQQ